MKKSVLLNLRSIALALGVYAALWGSTYLLLIGASDAIECTSILHGTYRTPWYDGRWWVQPYTHLILFGKPHHTYWTHNVLGQPWLIRDTTVDGKEFWTILRRG